MIKLIFAAFLFTNCQQCVKGKIKVDCPDCFGKGELIKNYKLIPCRRCPDRLYNPNKKSSGKIKVKCYYCQGKRKIKVLTIDTKKEK